MKDKIKKTEAELKSAILQKVSSKNKESFELLIAYIDAKLEFLNDLKPIEEIEEN